MTRQSGLKRHLNELIGRAQAHVAETDRMALDTGDGAALPAELLTRATRALATHLGPMGLVMVDRAVPQARDTEHLFALAADIDRLALHIDDPAKRAAFLRALDDV